ncbi:MAG: hypothetical protein M0Z69_03415 [Actinomycetota bacterium]|nr:hypothetical protein [Actinomycetota bacterium]
MSGYVEAGYSVVLVALGGYSISVVVRERAARRRLPAKLPGRSADRTGEDGGGSR